jgi:hypothetical protein
MLQESMVCRRMLAVESMEPLCVAVENFDLGIGHNSEGGAEEACA